LTGGLKCEKVTLPVQSWQKEIGMCYWCDDASCKNCYKDVYEKMFEDNENGTIVVVDDGDESRYEAKDWVEDKLGEYLEGMEDTFDKGEVYGRCSAYAELLKGKELVEKLNAEFKRAGLDFFAAELGVWRYPDGKVEGLAGKGKT
jgi:hypothetical protein